MALTNQRRNIMTAGFTAAAPGTGTATVALSSAAGAGGWGTGFSQTGAPARGAIFLQSSLPLILQ